MRFRTYKYLSSMVTVGIIVLLGWLIICTVGFFTTDESQKIYPLMMTSLSFIGMLIFYIDRRVFYSNILVNEKGITNKCVLSKDIFVAWDDCVEIGLWKMPMGYGLYNVGIYFSTEPIPQKQRNRIGKIKLSNKHLWMQYDEKAMTEILKYVDKNRIVDYHLCL